MKSIQLLGVLSALGFLMGACGFSVIHPQREIATYPEIFPDYTAVTIPSTIAPLNFGWQRGDAEMAVIITGEKGDSLWASGEGFVQIPQKQWAALLQQNCGDSLQVRVFAKEQTGWVAYRPFPIYIAEDSIDYSLVYRLIAPGYTLYSQMGIYQRELSSFRQTALLENRFVERSCINCHSFLQNKPEKFSLHVRGEKGGTILSQADAIEVLSTKTDQTIAPCVYPYWHPSGRFIAYSVNQTRQSFYATRNPLVEVHDLRSDIVIYDVEKHELFSCPQLQSEAAFETFPAFSPDGKSLYFCSSKMQPFAQYDSVRYDLCRIGIDPQTRCFSSEVDTLVKVSDIGASISFPRPSPDGKFLMFTRFAYGNFSIWHKEADLWLYDISTGTARALEEVNSEDTESYHGWSSNSRWFVFSSRRIDGQYTRLYLSSIDAHGVATKPFLLPQQSRHYYKDLFYSYNIPEFVTAPVLLDHQEAARQIENGLQRQISFAK